MTKMSNFLFAGTLIAFCAPAYAQSVSLDMANEYGENSIHAEGDKLFTQLVREKTSGEVEITVHYGASLGFRSKDQIDAVGMGALPLADTFTGPLAGIHWVFQTSALPFLTRDFGDARDLFEVALPKYEEVLEANNQMLLWSSPWPPAGIWANKEIRDLSGLQDTKIRTYDQLGTITLSKVGAAPVQMSWADVVPQLSSGALDGVLTSIEAGMSSSLQDFLKNFAPVMIGTPLNIATINKDVFDSLSESQKAAILEAAKEVQDHQWEILEDRVANNRVRAKEAGVALATDLDPEMMAKLQAAGELAIESWYEKSGDEGRALVEEFRKRQAQ